MPNFNVTGPDGKTYRVEAPAGATQRDAIAYVADTYYGGGATPSAPLLPPTPAAPAPVAKPQEEEGFLLSALKRGVPLLKESVAKVIEEAPAIAATTLNTFRPGSVISGTDILAGLGALAPQLAPTYKDITKGTVEGLRKGAQEDLARLGPGQYGGFFEEQGFGRKFGSLAETVAESALPVGAGIATGLLTRSPTAAGLVMGVGSAPMTYSGIRERQEKEGIDDIQRAVIGTAASSALDVLTGIGGKVLSGTAALAAREILEGGIKQALVRTAKSGGEEALTEALQNVVEQVAGGTNPATKQAMLETIEAGLAGGLGGTVFGGARELVTAPFRSRNKKAIAQQVASSPQGIAEFQRLAMEAVGQVMQANPGMSRNDAVALVEQNAEQLRLRAVANILGAEGEADVDTGMDVGGGGGAGFAPNLEPGAAPVGAGELGEAVTGRLGEPVPSVPVPDVGAGAGIPALDLTDFAPTIEAIQEAPDNKTRKPLAMQLVSDVVQATPALQGLGPKAYTQAANQIVLAAARGTAFDPVAIVAGVAPKAKAAPAPEKVPGVSRTTVNINGQERVIETPTTSAGVQQLAAELGATAPTTEYDERGRPIKPKFTLVTGAEEEAAPAPTVAETATVEKVTPPAQKTMNDLAGAGTVNPENTNEVLVQGGGVQITPVADNVVQLDSLRAVEKGGGRKAMQQLVQAADQNGTAIQLSPEPFAAPAGKEMSPTELTEWYKGFGFQEQPDGSMVRPAAAPPSTITQEAPREYTPQEIVDNLRRFGYQEARDRGYDPNDAEGTRAFAMFNEGVRDSNRDIEPIADDVILGRMGPQALQAYKEGMQWGKDRIADAAKSTATEADIDPVILAKRDELREKIMAAPGDTIRQKIIGLMSKETNEALKAAKTPEELAKFLGLDETSPLMDEVLRGEAGIDDERMKDILKKLYQGAPDQMAHVCVKEILQNSHDAVRDALRMGLITEGNISFEVSEDGLTFTTTDNGKGMSPQVLQGPFLKVGSTGKGAAGESHSGGYGLAKTLFLYGNKAIKVITANNGIISTMETSGEQLGKAFVTRDPNDQPLIYSRPFGPDDYAIFPEGHGTKLTLTLPSQDVDPESGKLVDVKPLPDYPATSSLPGMGYSPLFSPVNVTYQKEGDIEYRVDIGSRFPYADFAEFAQVKLPSGTAVIYASRQPKKYAGSSDNVHILSDGVWQFSKGINVPGSYWDKIPYDFYINYIADPAIKPDNPLYPFTMDRKTFSSTGEKTYNNLSAILLNNYGLEDLYKDAKSFGTIQYFDPNTKTLGAVVDLTPEIPEIETGFGKLQGGADIVLGSDGRVAINGQEVDPENISDISSKLPKSSALIIDQNKIDPNKVMVHENANVVYTDKDGVEREVPIMEFLRETFGTKVDEFYYFMGDAFQQLRNEVADIMEYPALKTEAVGISVDPGYRGVSIKVPFSGMFINPLVPEAPAGPRALFGIVTTMIHELAHFKVRNHDAGFPAEMQRIQAALEASAFEQGFDFSAWKQRFVERAIDAGYIDLIRAGQDLFETRKDRESYTYGNPEYKNVRVVYRGQRFKDGAAEQVPDEGGAGLDGTPDTGAVGAGEGAGERLLGPAYEGREGAGGRRQPEGGEGGGPPLTEESVDKAVSVKLTKAQMRRLEAAAGLRRKDLNNMQKRIVQSRNSEETLSLIGKLTKIAQQSGETPGILASLMRSMPPAAYKFLLGFQQIETVFSLARIAKIKSLEKIDDMMRNGYIPYVNRIVVAADKISRDWADFASRDAEGNVALDDAIMISNMLDVDPSTALTAAEYMRRDKTLLDLQSELASEKDPAKQKGLKAQITRRKEDIQRVYFGGEDENGNAVAGWNDVPPDGRRIFKDARDFHRASFKEHYRLLMQRIDDAGFDEADAARVKGAITKMFAKAGERTIYFPVKRFGEYWLSAGNDFYMRESLSEINALAARLKEEQPERPISMGEGRENLRKRVASNDASGALKGILDLLDEGNAQGQITDMDDLRDLVFQMYLTSLPEADMRRRFIHREFTTGFSTDALRTFATSAVASANQLGRLAYNYKFQNQIEEAKKETEYNPMKPWLDTITAEVKMKVDGVMSPQTNDMIDAIIAFAGKLTFFNLLSAPSSAFMNLTQLHIVGLPVLSAEFGEAKTANMAARYTASFLAGREIPNPFRDEDGNIGLQAPEFRFENSAYMRGLKENNPERYKQTLAAWDYAREHDVIESTFSAGANLYERSNVPTGDFTFTQALRRGEAVTAAQRATANAINGLGYMFHKSEVIGRSIMYMSSFDLAYERAINEGKTPEEAGREARELATKLTNKGMFDFSNWNKSRFAQSRVGRLALQMQSYRQSMNMLLLRSFVRMLPYFNKEGKLAAARVFFGVAGMTALYGGLRVTHLSAMAMAAYTVLKYVESLFDDDDEEEEIKQGYLNENTVERELLKFADEKGNELSKKDMEYYLRSQWINETFGKGSTFQNALGLSDETAAKLAKVADMGLPALGGVDLSNSVALNEFWTPVEAKGNTPEVRALEMLARWGLGPTASTLASYVKAAQAWQDGDINKAFETMLPAAIRNYIKSERLQSEGLRVGKNEDIILKEPDYYTNGKAALQAFGFRDAETSRNMQLDIAAGKIEDEISKEQTKLLDKRYRAILDFEQDPSEKNEREWNRIEREIDIYNLNYPSNAITKDTKKRSLKAKRAEAADKAYGLGYDPDIPIRMPLVEERAAQMEAEQ